MRNILIAVASLLVLAAAMLQAQEITSKKLQDDVLVVTGTGGNITAVDTGDGLLVVDTFISPSTGRAARAEMEKHFPGVPIRYVINTHYHWDHTFGNQVFKDALIVAHINNSDRVRADYAERASEIQGAAGRIKELEAHLAQHAGKESDKAEEITEELERLKRMRENYGDFELVPAPFSLEAGARIELGGKTFHLFHFGPAHTDGDIIVLDAEDRVLVMGDVLFNHMLPYIDVNGGADIVNWIDTLSRLIGMADRYDAVVPGHGEVGDVQALRDKKQYLQDLWDLVAKARADGMTLEQAKEQLKLEKYSEWGRQAAWPDNIEEAWLIMKR